MHSDHHWICSRTGRRYPQRDDCRYELLNGLEQSCLKLYRMTNTNDIGEWLTQNLHDLIDVCDPSPETDLSSFMIDEIAISDLNWRGQLGDYQYGSGWELRLHIDISGEFPANLLPPALRHVNIHPYQTFRRSGTAGAMMLSKAWPQLAIMHTLIGTENSLDSFQWA